MSSSRAYEIKPDRARWSSLNDIESVRPTKFPGVRCPSCGVWATTGVVYPSLDLARVAIWRASPLSIDEFRRFAAAIEPLAGPNRPIVPGMEAGRLGGSATGAFGDFAWTNAWTPLLRESVWHSLRTLPLVGVPTNVTVREPREPLIELEALPSARLAASPAQCELCGRFQTARLDPVVVSASSFDDSVPIQRIAELPTILLINQTLADFVQERQLRDVLVSEVRLA